MLFALLFVAETFVVLVAFVVGLVVEGVDLVAVGGVVRVWAL